MKTIFTSVILLFAFLIALPLQAQENESWDVKLGKRKNNIWGRKIAEVNLGNTFTSYQPLFFKITETGEWQRVGVLGKKIMPYLPSNDYSMANFKAYKSKKSKSYWCLGLSITSLVGWSVSSIEYGIRKRDPSIRAFINPRSLLFLGGYLGFHFVGIHWNARGDLDLFRAINGNQLEESQKDLSMYLGISDAGGLAIGLRF